MLTDISYNAVHKFHRMFILKPLIMTRSVLYYHGYASPKLSQLLVTRNRIK